MFRTNKSARFPERLPDGMGGTAQRRPLAKSVEDARGLFAPHTPRVAVPAFTVVA